MEKFSGMIPRPKPQRRSEKSKLKDDVPRQIADSKNKIVDGVRSWARAIYAEQIDEIRPLRMAVLIEAGRLMMLEEAKKAEGKP